MSAGLVADERAGVTRGRRSGDVRAQADDEPPTRGLTEAQLSALWRGQRFPAGALVTRSGVAVRVIFQGRAGRGPGPDYRDAVISGPSGIELRGDVELHVRSSDFRAHGHHGDPAYGGVILHVVFSDDLGVDTALPGGGTAPVIALAPWVARRRGELATWMERPSLWREPCHDAVGRVGAAGAAALLDAEGDRRFERRVALLREDIAVHGLEQALYERVTEALGYGGNAPPMLALARRLPWVQLDALAGTGDDRLVRLEALLLGGAGLLPEQRQRACAMAPYARQLQRVFESCDLDSLDTGSWKLWGVRPENHPVRRIAGAAALIASVDAPSRWLGCAAAASASEATAPLCLTSSGFWRAHYDLLANPCRLAPALIGRSRAIEILINALLPAACAGADGALSDRARTLFARLPRAANYGATRFIEAALGAEGARIPMNARRAQGLLELNRSWCSRGGCGRCALSPR